MIILFCFYSYCIKSSNRANKKLKRKIRHKNHNQNTKTMNHVDDIRFEEKKNNIEMALRKMCVTIMQFQLNFTFKIYIFFYKYVTLIFICIFR